MGHEANYKYVAIPYLHEEERVMDFRASVADAVATDLMNKGEYVYSPISSWHHVARKYNLPRNWNFWNGLDREFIKVCSGMYVITLDGWEKSTGVTAEISIACQMELSINYIDPIPYLDDIEIPPEYTFLGANLILKSQEN